MLRAGPGVAALADGSGKALPPGRVLWLPAKFAARLGVRIGLGACQICSGRGQEAGLPSSNDVNELPGAPRREIRAFILIIKINVFTLGTSSSDSGEFYVC